MGVRASGSSKGGGEGKMQADGGQVQENAWVEAEVDCLKMFQWLLAPTDLVEFRNASERIDQSGASSSGPSAGEASSSAGKAKRAKAAKAAESTLKAVDDDVDTWAFFT